MKDKNQDGGYNLWGNGFFAESVSSAEMKEKMKTMHKDYNEDMNFNCKKCNKKISAHNKDWHDYMCDKCFNDEYSSKGVQLGTDSEQTDELMEKDEKEIVEKLENFNPEGHSISELCKETGIGIIAINEENKERFYPLLVTIEEVIWNHYLEDSSLKDSDVINSLKKIRDNLFSSEVKFNEMEKKIITRLKLVLFLNNYDKRDLSLSISKVLNSAKLHRSVGGSRGYLNFIVGVFNQLE